MDSTGKLDNWISESPCLALFRGRSYSEIRPSWRGYPWKIVKVDDFDLFLNTEVIGFIQKILGKAIKSDIRTITDTITTIK